MNQRACALPLLLLASCVASPEPSEDTVVDEVDATFPGCTAVETDRVYRCPSQDLPANAEFLYMKVQSSGTRSLYAGTLTGTTLTDAYVFAPPSGWVIETSSISPTRKLVLVTMNRPSCPRDWPNTAGASCSWGRGTLWLGFLKDGTGGQKYYELTNLTTYYGKNSAIVGWHTWLTNKKVLFNAKIVADGVNIMPDPLHGTGSAYVIDFEHDATKVTSVTTRLWGDSSLNNDQCFVGRMHAAMPTGGFRDTCVAGQRVVFARRCYDDPMGPQNFSWFNTVNYDGTGGVCRADAGAVNLVPAFKNYVVTVDAQCNPVGFDRTKPIRTPDYTGRYRHMAANPEWGDGQPTISLDGSTVAFWSRKSSTLSNSVNNCAGLESPDGSIGIGADRVRVCALDSQGKCSTLINLPEPANAWFTQGGAYFHPLDNGHPGVLVTENDGGWLVDLATNVRTRVLNGFGGYPILPR